MNKEKRKKKRKQRAKELRIERASTKSWSKVPKFLKKINGDGVSELVLNPDWFSVKE